MALKQEEKSKLYELCESHEGNLDKIQQGFRTWYKEMYNEAYSPTLETIRRHCKLQGLEVYLPREIPEQNKNSGRETPGEVLNSCGAISCTDVMRKTKPKVQPKDPLFAENVDTYNNALDRRTGNSHPLIDPSN